MHPIVPANATTGEFVLLWCKRQDMGRFTFPDKPRLINFQTILIQRKRHEFTLCQFPKSELSNNSLPAKGDDDELISQPFWQP
ncbi:hypothetical protein [Lacimicrobium alkaliphilum]|uniref:hypothetical protein n=1 Tax=Lacimicrobium alkaliphilum TaxID=1526571 RepID=UPI0018D2201C|nr:hypothetical protein [Lacimicrobium alkaliphilum]